MNVFLHDEIVVEVLVPSLIKPFPTADVLPSARASGRVLIAEESVRTAGWGAELAAALSEAAFADLKAPIHRIGAADHPIPSARHLEDETLPGTADIERALRQLAKG
jgi:pyruvate dehydrogenase E1 component beta subunit